MKVHTSEEFYTQFFKKLTFEVFQTDGFKIYKNKDRPRLGQMIRYCKEGSYDIFIANYTIAEDFSIKYEGSSKQIRFGTVHQGISVVEGVNREIKDFKPSSFFVYEDMPEVTQHWKKGQHFKGIEITIHQKWIEEVVKANYIREYGLLDRLERNLTYRYLPLSVSVVLTDLERLFLSGSVSEIFIDAKILECTALLTWELKSDEMKPYLGRHDLVEIKIGKRYMFLSGKDIKCIRKAKELIEVNCCSPMTIEALSEAVGINQQKLKAGFSAMYKTTIWKHANSIRMLNAANLLSSTEKSVGEIALYLGYSNISSFSSKFKEYFLMTPLEYRKESRLKPF